MADTLHKYIPLQYNYLLLFNMMRYILARNIAE
ncbi:hypothetical protein SAMN06265219_101321 [Gracilimonas mengyeensis]|uniref:Uncharacterized protein n=1 Tax=Gracilimonas mengyeensis TaxID=1302730 RepID=A0A521AQW5_9BACT|nr:hypothetical protein SAMN06265219_101321 [Gracilimonas mengyeensis]